MSMMIGGVDLQSAATRVAQSLSTPPTQKAATVHTAADTTATSTTDTSGSITSNDFLSLLVTEMKNQDPTQPTDPNAYIQQLVGVNSLQQLIAINKDLSGTMDAGSAVQTGVESVSATS